MVARMLDVVQTADKCFSLCSIHFVGRSLVCHVNVVQFLSFLRVNIVSREHENIFL